MIGILGRNSYIANKFLEYNNEKDNIEFIDCRDEKWSSVDFSSYNTLLCPIGIAHVSTDPSMEAKYYAINRDLPVKIAKKAKEDGSKHFIFFSSMIVYGTDKPIGTDFIIDRGIIRW